MSKRRSAQKRTQSATRPVISRKLSLAFAAVALVIFFAVQSGAGNLSTLLGVPPANATAVIEEGGTDNADNVPGSPQADQAVLTTATPAPIPTQPPPTAATATAAPHTTPAPTANAPPARRASNLPTIVYADLPPEAHETIRLIDQGGPFPFRKDGATFQNRERRLPARPSGYYREYTVITPGSDDRGARRIVAGGDGELYYTADHYGSFHEIVR